MDDEARGKILGHILLAGIRFICGAAIGFFIFMMAVGRLRQMSWFDPYVLGGCMLVCGLLAAAFGERFFDLFKSIFWRE